MEPATKKFKVEHKLIYWPINKNWNEHLLQGYSLPNNCTDQFEKIKSKASNGKQRSLSSCWTMGKWCNWSYSNFMEDLVLLRFDPKKLLKKNADVEKEYERLKCLPMPNQNNHWGSDFIPNQLPSIPISEEEERKK